MVVEGESDRLVVADSPPHGLQHESPPGGPNLLPEISLPRPNLDEYASRCRRGPRRRRDDELDCREPRRRRIAVAVADRDEPVAPVADELRRPSVAGPHRRPDDALEH